MTLEVIEAVFDRSVQTFLNLSQELIYKKEAENSLLIGLCESMLKRKPDRDPLLIRILNDGVLVSVAFQTPPMNLILTHSAPEYLSTLAEELKNRGIGLPGVVGPTDTVEYFAKIWADKLEKKYSLGMAQSIYKLEKLNDLPKVEGFFKVATGDDTELVTGWMIDFVQESLPKSDRENMEYYKTSVLKSIQEQKAFLWIKASKPVSMAFAARPTLNGCSINNVFTPKEHRNQGYGSAVVSSVCSKILSEGKKFCVLYADLSNPTSNKIYQRIGFKFEAYSSHFIFS